MDLIHGERGKMYYAKTCQNLDGKEKPYLQEVDNPYVEDINRNKLVGELVRCPMCTVQTVIDPGRFVLIEVR